MLDETSVDAGDQPLAPSLVHIWATLVELLPAAKQAHIHFGFSHFFELLKEFLQLGPETLAWASKAGGLNECLEFVFAYLIFGTLLAQPQQKTNCLHDCICINLFRRPSTIPM